jgi:hypothetical protein
MPRYRGQNPWSLFDDIGIGIAFSSISNLFFLDFSHDYSSSSYSSILGATSLLLHCLGLGVIKMMVFFFWVGCSVHHLQAALSLISGTSK